MNKSKVLELVKKEIEKTEGKERIELVEELFDVVSGYYEGNDCTVMASRDFGSGELKKEFAGLKSVWSSESRIRTFATVKILETLEKILERL